MITPPFSEFILDVGRVLKTHGPAHGTWGRWGVWTELDKTSERPDTETGFGVVIEVENLNMELNVSETPRD